MTRSIPLLILSILILAGILFSVSAIAAAPPKTPSPHKADAMPMPSSPHEAAMETGRIIGKLTGDAKAPLSAHTVVLEVLRGNALILSLPKQTDAQGRYEFKNIFRSPDFFYAISTEHGGKTFRTPFVSLRATETERTLDLTAGAGAPEAPPISSAATPEQMEEGKMPPPHGTGDGLGQYKLLAALLSLGAVAYALARRRT